MPALVAAAAKRSANPRDKGQLPSRKEHRKAFLVVTVRVGSVSRMPEEMRDGYKKGVTLFIET